MKLYKDYLATKHSEDDFLRWLLIRRLKLKQQLVLVAILWLVWIIVAPHLTLWVLFFKSVLFYWLVSSGISFGIRRFRGPYDDKRIDKVI